MKYLCFLSLVLIVTFSCTPPTQRQVSETGSLTINLPSRDEARTLFGSGNPGGPASDSVVAYGIVLFDPSTSKPYRTASTTINSSIVEITSILPYSNYSVVVIAFGFSEASLPGITTNDAFAIGSGETKIITINEGQNTTISVSLSPLDIAGYADPGKTKLTLSGTTGTASLFFGSLYLEYPTTNPGVFTKSEIILRYPTYNESSGLGGTFVNTILPFTAPTGASVGIYLSSVSIPTNATSMNITMADMKIFENSFRKNISELWPTLPLPEGISASQTSVKNIYGFGLGKNHFPVSSTSLFTYPFDGSPVNMNGGNLSVNILWTTGN